MFGFKPFSIIFISQLFIRSNQQAVSYDLQILKRNPKFESHLYLSLLSTDDFCIGTPYQCEKILFDPGVSYSMVLNSEKSDLNPIEGSYKVSLSTSYQSFPHKKGLIENRVQKLIDGYYSLEKVKFGSFEMDECPFVLTNTWISELHYSVIGLSVQTVAEPKFNYFINKLHEKALISIRQYCIELIDDLNGKITFGDINVDENKYKKIFRLNGYETYYVTRFYAVQSLSIGDGNPMNLKHRTIVHLDESVGFVQMPNFMKEQIQLYYLNSNLCREDTYHSPSRKELKINYSYFICAKSLLNTNYVKEDLVFDLYSGKVKLRKEDLFIEYDDDNYIFAIIFKNNRQDPLWVIGQPILKRYMLIKNYENDSVDFYEKINKANTAAQEMNNTLARFTLLCANWLLVIGSALTGLALVKNRKANYLML